MRYLFPFFAIATTLFVAQGCSSIKSKVNSTPLTPIVSANSHAESSMDHSSMPGMAMPEMTGSTQAKLTAPDRITPKSSVPLMIQVQDSQGKAIAQFTRFQEKLMHLIVVSDNLQVFNHIHPTYQGNGRFTVHATFPQSDNYTLFSDYKPSGGQEQVSVLNLQVPGTSLSTSTVDLRRSKNFTDLKADLTVSQPVLKAGGEVTLTFNLRQAENNQPATDLQPYLGERGHLVILKQSTPLTRSDYIHAHAVKGTPVGQISFMTAFPKPGQYKLWGQFKRNGKVVTTDFWVKVV